MEQNGLKTVELFAGIGGFRVGADENGIKTIWANDIDDNAVKVYKSKYGDDSIIQGDINTLIEKIPDHDILTGGFPCQPFSRAGKKLGVDDYRGTLFESIVKILKIKKPNYFILENVNSLLFMNNGSNFKIILKALSNEGYKIEWRIFNAESFGLPQHRERVIIIGSRLAKADESYFLTEDDIRDFSLKKFDLICDYSKWKDIDSKKRKFASWGMALGEKYVEAQLSHRQYKEHRNLSDIIESDVDDSFFFNEDTKKRIEDSVYVNKKYNGVQILYNQAGGARMGYSIFGIDGIAPTLTASTSRHYERYEINGNYRRLTNVEYARIQGFPDNQCEAVKPYNQYKLYGNAVPPAIVSYAFSRIANNLNRKISQIGEPSND